VTGAMQLEASSKVVGDADVERPVVSAGEDVNGVSAFFAHPGQCRAK
jgi:hypothetical protein